MPDNFHNTLPGLVDLTSDPSYVPPEQIPTQALDRHDGYRHPRPERAAATPSQATIEAAQFDDAAEAGKGSFSGQLNPADLAAAGIVQTLPAPRSGGRHRRPEAAPADPDTDQPTVRINIGKLSIGLPSGRTAADTLPLPKLVPAKPRDLARSVRVADYFSGRQKALQSMQEEQLTEADVIRNRSARRRGQTSL